jgi:hypothetical protein
MDLMHEANRHSISSLVYAQRAGWHTLPQSVLDDYAALEDLAAQYASSPEPGLVEQASTLTAQLRGATTGGEADALITGHIRPALEDFLADFENDIEEAGEFAAEPTAPAALQQAPSATQEAYTRLTGSALRWASIRSSWSILRGLSLTGTRDPEGPDSLHAEVANTRALRPTWDPSSPNGRLASPWQHNAFHVRLKWLLEHGAQIWAPTAAEQTEAWIANNPELVVR